MKDELPHEESLEAQVNTLLASFDFETVRWSVINAKLQCMSKIDTEFVSPSVSDLKRWAKQALLRAVDVGYAQNRAFFAEEVRDGELRLSYVPVEFKTTPLGSK